MAAAKWARRGILILAIVIALVPLLPLTENSFTDSSPQGSPGRSEPPWQGYGALPLRFDANAGQDPASVLYEATGSGMTAFLTSQG
ncbi:MAG TPA: hypothetical protein VHQ03_05640, partial [Candidatus Dormibacteraeota bacterium]|nr:hypothetical protein [Candidatus Dormibacteraeota bacterium]